ncbi:hypothetical protein ROZALSC1DRAFT_30431 [Rozella allomycis CSF55]|uniref:Uncharacterized protein n=1 Tax=Rozella allomycis (strain CSF55) TaxID=988480 RepID=A0A4P9YHS2_ROZAC|nr:hypothetical protein ROZALSC1DRAFT_30431 [Rozella allomycis CSF55]
MKLLSILICAPLILSQIIPVAVGTAATGMVGAGVGMNKEEQLHEKYDDVLKKAASMLEVLRRQGKDIQQNIEAVENVIANLKALQENPELIHSMSPGIVDPGQEFQNEPNAQMLQTDEGWADDQEPYPEQHMYMQHMNDPHSNEYQGENVENWDSIKAPDYSKVHLGAVDKKSQALHEDSRFQEKYNMYGNPYAKYYGDSNYDKYEKYNSAQKEQSYDEYNSPSAMHDVPSQYDSPQKTDYHYNSPYFGYENESDDFGSSDGYVQQVPVSKNRSDTKTAQKLESGSKQEEGNPDPKQVVDEYLESKQAFSDPVETKQESKQVNEPVESKQATVESKQYTGKQNNGDSNPEKVAAKLQPEDPEVNNVLKLDFFGGVSDKCLTNPISDIATTKSTEKKFNTQITKDRKIQSMRLRKVPKDTTIEFQADEKYVVKLLVKHEIIDAKICSFDEADGETIKIEKSVDSKLQGVKIQMNKK